MISFFEKNKDCPTCEQHIDELFKTDMISKKKTDADKIQMGMKELKLELDKVTNRKEEIRNITNTIRENHVSVANIDS